MNRAFIPLFTAVLLLLCLSCSQPDRSAEQRLPAVLKELPSERLVYRQYDRGGNSSEIVVDYITDKTGGRLMIMHETLQEGEVLPQLHTDFSSEIIIDMKTSSIISETMKVDELNLNQDYRGLTGCEISRRSPGRMDFRLSLKDGPQSSQLAQGYVLEKNYPLFTVNSLVLGGIRLFKTENFPPVYIFLQGGAPMPVEGTLVKAGEEDFNLGGAKVRAVRLEFRITDPLASKLLSRFIGDTAVYIEKKAHPRLLKLEFMGSTTVLQEIITLRD